MAEAKPLVPVLGLSHIAMRVTDLNRAIDYYDRLFGFRLFLDKRNAVAEGASPSVVGMLGDTAVELIETREPAIRRGREEPGYGCLAFGVADVEAALEALKSRGLTRFPEVALTDSGHKVMLFRDPDGNVLELIEVIGAPTLAALAKASLAETAAKAG
ncbi:MAG: VOC family protein [Caulobacteraceae bacterium]|nr:VOC family protein [Caulobacteraceae bacterium]